MVFEIEEDSNDDGRLQNNYLRTKYKLRQRIIFVKLLPSRFSTSRQFHGKTTGNINYQFAFLEHKVQE